MAALGFTINSGCAIVLAIGSVDDAIVVVEGAVHNIEEGHAGPPRRRSPRALIVGITLVLMSLFLPAAFLADHRMYAQFALVIAATALLSAINAATLKPTQAAMWLRPAVPPAAQHLLPRVQRRLRAHRALVRESDRRHGFSSAPMTPMIARHRAVLAGSDRLPADRGPGL